MNRVQLETEFQKELIEKLRQSEEAGVCQKRLAGDVQQHGGVSCARELIRRRRVSDGFAALASIGRLELSLEALVTTGRYGALFTDEEVNACFAALCDAGYYVWKRP